jgi:hypothetical protein
MSCKDYLFVEHNLAFFGASLEATHPSADKFALF